MPSFWNELAAAAGFAEFSRTSDRTLTLSRGKTKESYVASAPDEEYQSLDPAFLFSQTFAEAVPLDETPSLLHGLACLCKHTVLEGRSLYALVDL